MLSPNHRSLYTSTLTPPAGMVFDEAIATTFSLDPSVLLTVPIHLALMGDLDQESASGGLAILESVRRLADQITVYAQLGRMLVPTPPTPLYGLLEEMTVEVDVPSPSRGVFHPKLWLMRFHNLESGAVLLRLVVLTRNLTQDQSWDVALTLEGCPGKKVQEGASELAELVAALPDLAARPLEKARIDQARRLSNELLHTQWELPEGFDEISFRVLGLGKGGWIPERSDRLLVISPFCKETALERLANSTDEPVALLTRPETWLTLDAKVRDRFQRRLILHEAAETEDGEENSAPDGADTNGLHAKVYLFERGERLELAIGSANATNAALIAASNIEILAQLRGPTKGVGGIDSVLGSEGLGEVLCDALLSDDVKEQESDETVAEQVLEDARKSLTQAELRLDCLSGEEGVWSLRLRGAGARPDGVSSARFWPITVASDHGVEIWSEDDSERASVVGLSPASLTGLVAFDLVSPYGENQEKHLRFVLNLPVEGLPESRDAAILQTVVRNRDGFLRYLLLLLGGEDESASDAVGSGTGSSGFWASGGVGGMPLLEELVRAYCRTPERLKEVDAVIRRLTEGSQEQEIVPEEFLEVWSVFQTAIGRSDEL